MKKTLVDLFEEAVKHYPDHPFLWEKTADKFEPTTYRENTSPCLPPRSRSGFFGRKERG